MVTAAADGLPVRIAAVFFDWYGTLAPLAPLDAACEQVARGRGADFAARWRALQLETSWLRTIMGRWADFDAVTKAALDATMAEFRAAGEPTGRDALVRGFLELPVRRDAGTLLDELRSSGLAVGVLSNGSRETLMAGVERARLQLDHVLSADGVRRFKPDPSLYQQAVDATGLTTAEIGFVTANGWDAAGAGAFGLRVVWLRTNPQTALPPVDAPEPRVATWGELHSILARTPS